MNSQLLETMTEVSVQVVTCNILMSSFWKYKLREIASANSSACRDSKSNIQGGNNFLKCICMKVTLLCLIIIVSSAITSATLSTAMGDCRQRSSIIRKVH